MNHTPGLLIHRITPLCQLQDLGRWGYQKFGVSRSGAMDPYRLRLANLLVGNDQNEACLEFALAGGVFEVTARRLHFGFIGDFPLLINNEPFPANASYTLAKGEQLEIVATDGLKGTHGYLSVLGGFRTKPQLGSHSTHLRSGMSGLPEPLKRAAVLETRWAESPTAIERQVPEGVLPKPGKSIRVVPGPQSDAFTDQQTELFFATTWRVAPNSDRMGYRLEGASITVENPGNMISEAVSPGSVQITSSGHPIVLMPDCGTVGGYPKIATLISVDRGRLAQKRMGSEFRFERVDVSTAQEILAATEARLSAFGSNER